MERDTLIRFELPYPPSNNTYYRNTPRGTLLSKKARQYHIQAKIALIEQGIQNGFTCPVRVEFVLFPPDRKRRDLDNTLKSLCDSLQKCLILADDSQIKSLELNWGEVMKGGSVYVKVIPLDNWEMK